MSRRYFQRLVPNPTNVTIFFMISISLQIWICIYYIISINCRYYEVIYKRQSARLFACVAISIHNGTRFTVEFDNSMVITIWTEQEIRDKLSYSTQTFKRGNIIASMIFHETVLHPKSELNILLSKLHANLCMQTIQVCRIRHFVLLESKEDKIWIICIDKIDS